MVLGKWRDSVDLKWNNWHVSCPLTEYINITWVQWKDAMNMVMSLRVSYMTNFLRTWGAINFSRKIMFHAVRLSRLTMWHMSTLVSVLFAVRVSALGSQVGNPAGGTHVYRRVYVLFCVILWCSGHLRGHISCLNKICKTFKPYCFK
jgi:hypothetical protein